MTEQGFKIVYLLVEKGHGANKRTYWRNAGVAYPCRDVRIYTAIINQDYETAGTIVVAGAAGALFAPFVTEVTWFMGMLIGFSASGVITTASYFGSCSAVQVDKANVINTETLTGTNSKKKNA